MAASALAVRSRQSFLARDVGIVCEIAEAGHTSLELQIHCADGSMTLFADDHFSPVR